MHDCPGDFYRSWADVEETQRQPSSTSFVTSLHFQGSVFIL